MTEPYPKIIQLPGRPQMGEAAFTGPFGDAVRHLEQHSEADSAGLLYYLLSAYSAMLGRCVTVSVGTQTSHPRVWTVILGRTGIGRKGSAVREMDTLLDHVDPMFMGVNIYTELTSAEGLIVDMQDPFENGGREDKRLLILLEEFVSLMSTGGKLLPVLRTAWDGRSLFRSTAKDGMQIVTNPHFVVHGHATPDEFSHRLKKHHLAGGTYNRFLFGLVDMRQMVAFARYDDEVAYHRRTKDVAGVLRNNLDKVRRGHSDEKPLRMRMNTAAEKLYEAYYYGFIKSTSEAPTMVEQFTARNPTYVHMIAALYAIAGGRTVILPLDVEAAMAVVQYSPDTIEYLYNTLNGDAEVEDPRQRAVFDALVGAGKEGMSRSEIVHGPLKRNARKEEVDRIIEELKLVPRPRFNPNSGRTSLVFALPEYAKASS